ncbi:MAG TPA: TlpA disulfide reductase family protein [Planctomycetota bacterium]|nr:TlpA disulfide reductase family protein [Planctomycetota bacterium]
MRKVDAGRLRLRHRALLVLGLVLPAACGGERGSAGTSSRRAREPRIDVVGLEGVEAALQGRRGKGVLLNFWATWCAPCVAELPELVQVAEEFAERGGVLLGVSYDLMVPGAEAAEVPGQVRAFFARKGLDFDVLVYDAADFDGINSRFGLPGEIPVTLAFDRRGDLVDRQEGPGNRARFAEMMRRAVGK